MPYGYTYDSIFDSLRVMYSCTSEPDYGVSELFKKAQIIIVIAFAFP